MWALFFAQKQNIQDRKDNDYEDACISFRIELPYHVSFVLFLYGHVTALNIHIDHQNSEEYRNGSRLH